MSKDFCRCRREEQQHMIGRMRVSGIACTRERRLECIRRRRSRPCRRRTSTEGGRMTCVRLMIVSSKNQCKKLSKINKRGQNNLKIGVPPSHHPPHRRPLRVKCLHPSTNSSNNQSSEPQRRRCKVDRVVHPCQFRNSTGNHLIQLGVGGCLCQWVILLLLLYFSST